MDKANKENENKAEGPSRKRARKWEVDQKIWRRNKNKRS